MYLGAITNAAASTWSVYSLYTITRSSCNFPGIVFLSCERLIPRIPLSSVSSTYQPVILSSKYWKPHVHLITPSTSFSQPRFSRRTDCRWRPRYRRYSWKNPRVKNRSPPADRMTQRYRRTIPRRYLQPRGRTQREETMTTYPKSFRCRAIMLAQQQQRILIIMQVCDVYNVYFNWKQRAAVCLEETTSFFVIYIIIAMALGCARRKV